MVEALAWAGSHPAEVQMETGSDCPYPDLSASALVISDSILENLSVAAYKELVASVVASAVASAVVVASVVAVVVVASVVVASVVDASVAAATAVAVAWAFEEETLCTVIRNMAKSSRHPGETAMGRTEGSAVESCSQKTAGLETGLGRGSLDPGS